MKINGKGNWKLNTLGGVAIGAFLLVSGMLAGGNSGTAHQLNVQEETSAPIAASGLPTRDQWCTSFAQASAGAIIKYRDEGLDAKDAIDAIMHEEYDFGVHETQAEYDTTLQFAPDSHHHFVSNPLRWDHLSDLSFQMNLMHGGSSYSMPNEGLEAVALLQCNQTISYELGE